MEKQIETGLFSGSFNPIHMGHLMLAGYISAFTYVDEVWFVVTPHNPLKVKESLLPDDIRLEMARLALADYDNLKVSDVEFRMPRPSYTSDTLNALTQEHPDRRFSLIIGGDNWLLFDKWKDYEQIMERYQILIYPRPGENIRIPKRLRNRCSWSMRPRWKYLPRLFAMPSKKAKICAPFSHPGYMIISKRIDFIAISRQLFSCQRSAISFSEAIVEHAAVSK